MWKWSFCHMDRGQKSSAIAHNYSPFPPLPKAYAHNKERTTARLRAGSCALTTICPNDAKAAPVMG